MSYRKDYDDYPEDYDEPILDLDYDEDEYFYDDPDSGWENETFSSRLGEGRYREEEDLYEDEIERMRRRKQAPASKRNPKAKKRTVSEPSDFSHHTRRNLQNKTKAGQGRSDQNSRYQNKKQKKSGKIITGVFLGIAVIIGVLFIQRWWKLRDGYWNIAVFGVDSRSGSMEKGALSDVEIICSINKRTHEIRLVSVYRDTYLQIDEKGNFDKINEAYFLGGHEQAVDALERNLDIQIDDYATFNWKAVADAINLLGGIDLEIMDKEFAYINSFITETVQSTGIGSYQLEHAGMNHLDGVQAVAYCRLRLMDTDFNRTERQRKVIMLALEKAKQADISVLSNIVAGVLPQVSTSIGAEDIMPLAKNISKYEIGQTAGFPFAKATARIEKKDCVIPMTLESNVAALHQFLYGPDSSYRVSSQTKKISSKISEISGIYEEGEIPGFIYEPEGKKEESQGAGDSQGNSNNAGTKPAVPETAAPVPESTIEETTAPETSGAETQSEPETSESSESESETIESNESSDEENDPKEPQTNPGGPGIDEPSGNTNRPSKPSESTEAGPGVNLPDPETSSPGIIHSNTEPSGENTPDSQGSSPAGNNSSLIGPGMPEEVPLYTPSYE